MTRTHISHIYHINIIRITPKSSKSFIITSKMWHNNGSCSEYINDTQENNVEAAPIIRPSMPSAPSSDLSKTKQKRMAQTHEEAFIGMQK